MAKLILTMDGAILREFPVAAESISIGRKAGNDIQLNDLTVSGRHVLITTMGNNTYVDDLGSTNGTLLNGKRVKKALLKHGDVIQVGAHQLTYYLEGEEEYEPTMFIKAELEPTKVMNPGSRSAAEAKGEPLAAVKMMSGPLKDKVLELRKPFNTLGFNGMKMAMIARTPSGYTISALKGLRLRRATDAPMVNGEIVSHDPRKLRNTDIIEVAGIKMEFYYLQ